MAQLRAICVDILITWSVYAIIIRFTRITAVRLIASPCTDDTPSSQLGGCDEDAGDSAGTPE